MKTGAMGSYQDLFTAVSALAGALVDALTHVTHLMIAVGGLVLILCELLVSVTYIICKHLLWLFLQSLEILEITLRYISLSFLHAVQWMYQGVLRLWHVLGVESSTLSWNQVTSSSKNMIIITKDIIVEYITYITSTISHLMCYIGLSLYKNIIEASNFFVTFTEEMVKKFQQTLTFCYQANVTLVELIWDCVTLEYAVVLLITFLGVCISIIFVQQLHGRGFHVFLPVPVHEIHLQGINGADFIESDVETEGFEDDSEEVETSSGGSEEDIDQADDVSDDDDEDNDDEMTVADSDSDTSDSENDENNQNTINIHLPEPGRRGRHTPGRELDTKMGPEELRKRLVSERDGRSCVVCQDLPKSVLILPCKHVCLCVDCAHEISQSRPRYRRVCPLCRERIETVMYVYV